MANLKIMDQHRTYKPMVARMSSTEKAEDRLCAQDFLGMSRKELMHVMCNGYPIEPSALDNMEYKGISLGLPRWIEKLTWKKFKKVFFREPDTDVLRGWNVRIVQDGLDQPWTPQMKGEERRTFGHYEVVDPEGCKMPKPCGGGLLIHYGLGGNRRFSPISRLRDPIVAVNPESADLLLGWSYLDLGFVRVGTPSFFTLERDCELTHRVLPPRKRKSVTV